MVEIVEKKLIQLSNMLVVTVPKDFCKRYFLGKGATVNLVKMRDAFMVVDKSTDFNAEAIKADLDEAQKNWDEKEDRKQQKWFNHLSPEEQTKIMQSYEETDKVLIGEGFDENDPSVINLDSIDIARARAREGTGKHLPTAIVTRNGKVDKEWLKTLPPERIADLQNFYTEMLEVIKEVETGK